MSSEERFNVYWTDNSGNQHREKTRVLYPEAREAILRLTQGPSNTLGIVTSVLLTDMNDFTCFLWEEGKVIFPTENDVILHQNP